MKHTRKQHCLLVFDSFKAHITDDVMEALETANASVVVLPGGCTSKAQPVDVSLNQPIKDRGGGAGGAIAPPNISVGEHHSQNLTGNILYIQNSQRVLFMLAVRN